MEVILTDDVPKLGIAGQVVRVRAGYARNYLLPRGLALLATPGRVRDLEHKRRVIDEAQRRQVSGHEEVARRMGSVELEFRVQAGEEGKLFGSVTAADIARELAGRGFEIERRRVDLEEPIKQTGDYEVRVRLHRQVQTTLRVHVLPVAVPGQPVQEQEEAVVESEQEETE